MDTQVKSSPASGVRSPGEHLGRSPEEGSRTSSQRAESSVRKPKHRCPHPEQGQNADGKTSLEEDDRGPEPRRNHCSLLPSHPQTCSAPQTPRLLLVSGLSSPAPLPTTRPPVPMSLTPSSHSLLHSGANLPRPACQPWYR